MAIPDYQALMLPLLKRADLGGLLLAYNLTVVLRNPKLLLYLALAIAFATLIPFLGSVPGLHGDEAWAGVRASEILHGARPLLGMNEYTGPFHQYLIAAIFSFAGYSVTALRLTTAICFLLTVPIYFWVAKFLFDEWTAAIAALVLVTCPFFMGYGRIATENFALNPLLALASVALLMPTRRPLSLLSGICLGLGCWNHVIFFAWALSLLFTAVCFYRAKIFRSYHFYFCLIGWFLIAGVRALAGLPSINSGGMQLSSIFERIYEWPMIFAQTLHGDSLFLRFTGAIKMATPQILAPVIVAGSIFNLYRHFKRPLPFERHVLMLLFFVLSLFVITAVISPGNSDRYFLLPLFCAPLLVAVFFRQITLQRDFAPIVVLAIFLGLQLARIEINYFQSFIESGGREAEFSLGSMRETSNHFVDTKALGDKLRSLGAQRVLAEFFISMPLQFYSLGSAGNAIIRCDNAHCIKPYLGQEFYAVTYNGGINRLSPNYFGSPERVSADEHFTIWKVK
jgi:4-amino-4-deoxy-L-arabinose transferase-like glycosyltransferase